MFRIALQVTQFRQIAIATLAMVMVATSMASIAMAGPGDTLYVKKRGVVLRVKPSPQASKVIDLHLGQKLMEFGRQGAWVEVGAVRTGGKTGWVPLSVVGARKPSNAVSAPDPPGFKRLKTALEKVNSEVERKTGVKLFTEAKALGDGMVQVTASDAWLSTPAKARESNMRTLFNLWDAAEGSGLPLALYVVDRRGKQVMSMTRR